MLFCHVLSAQTGLSNLRHITIRSDADSIRVDTLKLVYNSFELFLNNTRVTAGYSIDYTTSILVLDSTLRNMDLELFYRVLEAIPVRTYTHKFPDLIEPAFTREPKAFYNYQKNTGGTSALFGDGLNVIGNIARGIGFGNNQDVVLNSNLNLQLNGKLGKGIIIKAAISDENNPIQPQGNTQQIQDFDKVYISIMKDSNSLTVGDFLMNTDREQYFMKFYKKSRGLKLDINTHSKISQQIRANAAISRGKFVRNELQGQEGVQGPYRLQGANNEFNIIVISGTEAVYLDGQKLERGQQNDYIIDYNTGDIIFMPGRLITRYSRIVVEFQYSDRNYSRSVFTFSDAVNYGRWRASVNYFTEQDNKLQPTDTSNRLGIQTILENAGDAPAVYQAERKYTQFQTDRVNYRKIDSLGYNIYIYSDQTSSDSFFYTTTFSFTGKGKGNYIQIATSANGRVFAWVKPVNGLPAGDYEPYIQLVAPKRLQMLTANTSYSNGEQFDLHIEAAYTNDNRNTYSTLDKRNDDGLGLFLSINHKSKPFKDLTIGSRIKMEFINSNFKYIERYRSVEFSRIWNRQLSNTTQTGGANELISVLGATLNFRQIHTLSIEASNYNKGAFYNGYRGTGSYRYSGTKLMFSLFGEQLASSGQNGSVRNKNLSGSWKMESIYTLKGIKIGTNVSLESSRFNSDTSIGFEFGSFKNEQLSAYFESTGLLKWRYKMEALYRTDYLPISGHFNYISAGTTMNASLEHSGMKLNRLKFVGSYRKLNQAGILQDDEVIVSRVEYNATFLNKIISSSTYYQVGTGKEQKKQFSFALVQAGNGTHTWIDYNGNGIEEINEFEPAVYKDQARYVKVYLPTNEFIKSNTNEFNQTFRVQAPTSWQTKGNLKRFIYRFNTITSYKADRRITDNRLITVFNPFKLNVVDSALIAVSSLIKQTTFFNRSNAVFGLEHNIQTNKGKQFLNSGFEWRQNDKQQLISRIAFSRRFNLVTDGEISRKQSRNQFFDNRNFNYQLKAIQPELFYQTNKGIRIGTYIKYSEAFNAQEYGGDQAFLQESGLELRYFIINRGNIDMKIASHNINFHGNANSPLAFDVLNGLSNGNNLTWTLGFGGKTKTNIQFNVSYEGRKTQVYKIIHIGRAEARYIF